MIVFNSVKCFCCCFHSRIDPTAELKKDSTNEQEKNAAIFLINTLTIHKSQIAIELFRVFHCAMCLLCITTFSVFDFYRLFFFISTRFDHSILIFFLTVSFSFAYMTMGTLYFSNVKFKHSDSIFLFFFIVELWNTSLLLKLFMSTNALMNQNRIFFCLNIYERLGENYVHMKAEKKEIFELIHGNRTYEQI